MTFPPPHPAAQNSIASTNKSSGVRLARAQPSAWGLPAPTTGARRGLTPLATDLGSSSLEPTSRPTSIASPFTSSFSSVVNSSVVNSSNRTANSRNNYSTPSTASSFSPSQSGSQQPPQLLLSPRSRAITPSSNSYLAPSAAASSTASQGGGGSSSGGGSQRNQAFPPSSQQQSLSSPTNNTFDRLAFGGSISSPGNSGQSSVSKIVVAQVFLLLGSITEKEGKAKWDSQAEAIHKVKLGDLDALCPLG